MHIQVRDVALELHAIIPMMTDTVPLLPHALDEAEETSWRWTKAMIKERMHETLMRKLQSKETRDAIIRDLQQVMETIKADLEQLKQRNREEKLVYENMVEELKSGLVHFLS